MPPHIKILLKKTAVFIICYIVTYCGIVALSEIAGLLNSLSANIVENEWPLFSQVLRFKSIASIFVAIIFYLLVRKIYLKDSE